jgi:alanine racemase
MIIRFSDLVNICKGQLISLGTDYAVQHLALDSRKALISHETLFFAIKGERHDGHQYLKELYEKGLRMFVLETAVPLPEDANVLLVANSVRALQMLAAYKRTSLRCPVVGITGSNGKTIVKEYLAQLMSHRSLTLKSPKSFNSQIGVPLSVWPSAEYYQLAVFEAGISQPGEMEYLQKVIQPGLGIFTNIGPAHDEGFESRKQKIQEKLKLFQHAEKVIYCRDQSLLAAEIEACPYPFERVSWSRKGAATYQIPNTIRSQGKVRLYLSGRDKQVTIETRESDPASLENTLHTLVAALELGLDPDDLQKHLLELPHVGMRLELKEGIHQCQLIDDTYNNDPAGLAAALDFMAQHKQKPKSTLILSDMEQTGLAAAELYQKVAEQVNHFKPDRFIGVGQQVYTYQHLFKVPSFFFNQTEDLLNALSQFDFQGECILVKGARSFSFEQIVKALQVRQHGTRMEINLDSITHNLNYYRSWLQPGVKLMAMVKALAYGSGSAEIASLLQYQQLSYLAVAYPDEGVDLRENGIKMPIMVTSASALHFETLYKYRLEPEIYSTEMLDEWCRFAEDRKSTGPAIHLKLDTGMHRLGFETEAQLKSAAEKLKAKRVDVASIFSHLAASEATEHDAFTLQQIETFNKLSHLFAEAYGRMPMRHLLNTAGIKRFPQAQYDMVRLGIGLYGISGNESEQALLRPAGRLITHVLQIKQVGVGETIGYGRLGKALRPTKIATLAIGYADGFPRKLGNGAGKVFFKQGPAPTIGNVCMDMVMVDVTGLAVDVGDEAIVFDENHTVHECAKVLETIPYEVLTNIHERVKRVFYAE